MKKYLENAEILENLGQLPTIGKNYRGRGLCVAVELQAEYKEGYAIFIARYASDGELNRVDPGVNVAEWSYAIRRDNVIEKAAAIRKAATDKTAAADVNR